MVCSITVFRLALEGPRAKMVGFEPPQARRKLVRERESQVGTDKASVAVRVVELRCRETTRCTSNGVMTLVIHACARYSVRPPLAASKIQSHRLGTSSDVYRQVLRLLSIANAVVRALLDNDR